MLLTLTGNLTSISQALLAELKDINVTEIVLGVAAPVVFFIFEYRRTVGARKERALSANETVEKTLLRRFVLDAHLPSTEQIRTLLETKARDFRVSTSHLLSPPELKAALYTRIFESDFLTTDQRRDLIDTLLDTAQQQEAPLGRTPTHQPSPKAVEELRLEAAALRYHRRVSGLRDRLREMAVIGVGASVVGSVLALLFGIDDANVDSIEAVVYVLLPTLLMSLFAMFFVIGLVRFRERQQEHTAALSYALRADRFEREFLAMVRRFGLEPQPAASGARDGPGHDWLVELGGERLLVELKSWGKGVPPSLAEQTVRRLRSRIGDTDASRAIILTRNKVLPSAAAGQEETVEIVSLRQFRNYLAHGSR